MKKIALLLAVLPLFLHAQDSTSKPACFKPWSVELLSGFNFYADIPLNLSDMKLVAPSSQLMQRDFTGYRTDGGLFFRNYTINSNPYISAMVDFVPYGKRKKDYQWFSTVRFGISFNQLSVQGPSYSKQERTHIDTLYVSNGSTVYNDSVNNKSYTFQWTGQSIGLDASQMFHTDESRHFSIGMGYGVHVGMAMNTVFRAVYSNYGYIESTTVTSNSYESVQNDTYFDAETENIRTKNVMMARVYFPITMQLRLSKKKNFLNKVALTSESRGSIDIQPIPGYGTLTRFYFNQNFGLKYYFAYNTTK